MRADSVSLWLLLRGRFSPCSADPTSFLPVGGESIRSGTDVRADSVSLSLLLRGRFSSCSADPTSFPPVPNCFGSSLFVLRETGARGVFFPPDFTSICNPLGYERS